VVLSSTGRIVLHGGLVAVAVLSCLVVVASILPEGPVSWALGRRPLRALGRIAIALYLIHWPVFVWIDPQRSGLSHYPLLGVRLVVAFAGAVALQWAAERLNRREATHDAPGRTLAWMGTIATAVVVVFLVATSVTAPKVTVGVIAGDQSGAAEATPPTVAFYGDALAVGLEASAKTWAEQTGEITVIPGVTTATCGLDHGGTRRLVFLDDVIPPECDATDANWAAAVAAGAPDVAVVITGISEVSDHQQPTDGTWVRPGDAAYDAQLTLLMTKAVATLSASGSKVLWVNLPPFTADSGPRANPARIDQFNHLIQQVALGASGTVTVVDLSGWAPTQDAGTVTPSSAGFTPAEADRIIAEFLGPAIVAAASPGPTAPSVTTPPTDPTTTVPPSSLSVTPGG